MRNAIGAGRVYGVLQKGARTVVATNESGRREHESAVASHQTAAACRFQLFPDFVRAQYQRHEFPPFAKGLARNAGLAMRGTLVMGRRESVNTHDLCAEFGGLVERGASHCAQSDDNNVRCNCHCRHDATRDESRRKWALHERLLRATSYDDSAGKFACCLSQPVDDRARRRDSARQR